MLNAGADTGDLSGTVWEPPAESLNVVMVSIMCFNPRRSRDVTRDPYKGE